MIFKVLTHPVTVFNLLLVGILGFIEVVHIQAHKSMDIDANSHVRQWCKKNQDKCESFLSNY
jgi:hypothetical protein